MSGQATYRVVTNGGVIQGFDELDSVSSFAKLFDMTTEKATSFLQADKLINKNLTKLRADDYKTKMDSLGIPVSVQLEEQASETIELTTQTIEFTCPKCQLAQHKGAECTGCGIIFDKYCNRNKSTTAVEKSNLSSDTGNDEKALPLIAFIAPLIAAIVGAFVWKAIAISFDYELGLIAWAIGGAVGAAAVIAGGRGDAMGGYCAVITLLAIFLGKYMFMSSVQQELVTIFNGEEGSEIMTELYEEAEYDAQVFATIDKSDASVKTFMVDHGYTDASAFVFVSDQELEDFRVETQPWLESDTPEKVFTDSFLDEPTLAGAMSSVSPTSMVFGSLGIIDFIFAFLGLTTAFRLGRSGFGNTN